MPLENTDAEERITRETMIGWIEHWGESYDDVRPDTAWPPKNPASRSSWRARPQPPIRTNRRWTS